MCNVFTITALRRYTSAHHTVLEHEKLVTPSPPTATPVVVSRIASSVSELSQFTRIQSSKSHSHPLGPQTGPSMHAWREKVWRVSLAMEHRPKEMENNSSKDWLYDIANF